MAFLDLAPAGPARGTALLVPGFTGGKEDFAPILDPLSDAGFRVVAADLPGQYESPGPRDRTAYTPDWLGSVVNELAKSLDDERVFLLGHSFGGLVARAAVMAAPKRYQSLVLLCSGPSAIQGARRETMARLEPFAQRGMPAVYAARLEVYPPDPTAPERLTAFLRDRFLASSLDGLFGMSDALLQEPDRVDELRATGVPVLVCFGQDDDAWRPALQRDMATRLDATVVAIPGAAHSPAIERPEATVTSLVAFWAGGTV
ncbi:alpha/beta hydrolase [Rugosimonospora acidiphila]|uniref:Alpha/beta hydrolase n=1 Tax=Rugosimonospora acidiphila TaxID=556531 RepID=A0ABP9SF61_9ACTN